MKKMFVVDECFQCPHFWKMYNNKTDMEEMVCSEKEREVKNPFEIPKWCPLPNVPLK